jgi:hypothetical protein|tara:strand:+ start:102 stop:533 length:432 start_codon:yes stop_codon:yes gene_type:complete
MKATAYNTNSAALAEIDPEDAFEESGSYQFQGRPLYFSRRHYFALMSIATGVTMSKEEQVLLAFFVATHDPDDIKELRSTFRRNPDAVWDRFEDVPDDYNLHPNSASLIEIAETVEMMLRDIEASTDQAEDTESEEEDSQPGK